MQSWPTNCVKFHTLARFIVLIPLRALQWRICAESIT